MRVLVAGGAGFIGSHMCRFLLKEGNYVICVDDLSTGDLDNIKDLKENFEYIKHDIIEPISLDVDQIYHLASRASPLKYQSHPIHTMRTNAIGTDNMLKLANENNARILYSSTSEVYGDPEVHPQTEDYWGNVNPNGIRSCYDESKRYGEAICMAYKRKHNTDIRIARIFNTYGPNMQADDGRVVTNFINQAIEEKPLTVYGDGKQTRSFCYVDDMIRGLHKLMNSDTIGPVNLGNPNEITILEIADRILEITGSDSELVFRPLPKDDPTRRRPDITRAREKLGWEPEVGLNTGLRKTVDFFNS